MSDVFISYAREDLATAQILADALEKAGFSVSWDRHIPPGKTWDDVIGRALDDAACVIVLWSKMSVMSRWVREEADRAFSRGCLIPALVEKVDPPFGFGRIQLADLSRWQGDEHESEFAGLLAEVSGHARAPRSSKRNARRTVGKAALEKRRIRQDAAPLIKFLRRKSRWILALVCLVTLATVVVIFLFPGAPKVVRVSLDGREISPSLCPPKACELRCYEPVDITIRPRGYASAYLKDKDLMYLQDGQMVITSGNSGSVKLSPGEGCFADTEDFELIIVTGRSPLPTTKALQPWRESDLKIPGTNRWGPVHLFYKRP